MIRLPKNSDKKYQMPWRTLHMPIPPPLLPALWADSKMTMATASLRMDSPKMMVYSFGSTLNVLKMAKMVTGSVADRVAPTEIASTHVTSRPSSEMDV
jgi:hypothetical protein